MGMERDSCVSVGVVIDLCVCGTMRARTNGGGGRVFCLCCATTHTHVFVLAFSFSLFFLFASHTKKMKALFLRGGAGSRHAPRRLAAVPETEVRRAGRRREGRGARAEGVFFSSFQLRAVQKKI